MSQQVSIIGCGYTGQRLAERFLIAGKCVRGLSRRIERLGQMARLGLECFSLDLDATVEQVDVSGHLVYFTVPPAPAQRDERLFRFLNAIWGAPARFIYISTTGVYGDQGGATVNEDAPPAPRSERAYRRLASENMMREWAEMRGVSWCILRVPGIYGPGRLPLDRLIQANPAITPADATPGNRIHVTDLVSACINAGLVPRANGRIYNVTDGSDESHSEFLQRVARIAHLPFPPLISRAEAERTFSPLLWSYLVESRRVDNGRMLAELGVVLQYADLDAGIRASLMVA